MGGVKGEYANGQKLPTRTRRLLRRQNASFRMGLGPGFGGNRRHFALLHIRQAAEHLAQIERRIDSVAMTASQDRVDHRAALARFRKAVGVTSGHETLGLAL